ncbi:CatB-related O-acetyltransferase [bacterium]|nr:CatB-related O-acetyltransferase [bacterium]
MRINFIQNIIDVLRGKGTRLFALDFRVKADNPHWIDSNSTFGDYSQMGRHVNITHSKIGRYCTIGNFVTIGAGEHSIDKISTSFLCISGVKELVKLPLEIKNDVWIGDDSVIRRGVVVGNCAVVLPNSFVNKDVPDFAVVGGCPAKIIKYRFDEKTQENILKSQYWKYEPKKAKSLIKEIMKKNEL